MVLRNGLILSSNIFFRYLGIIALGISLIIGIASVLLGILFSTDWLLRVLSGIIKLALGTFIGG